MSPQQTIKVISWTWFTIGALAIASGLVSFLFSFLSPPDVSLFPVGSVVIDFMFRHYRVGTLVQCALGLSTIFTAVMLRRRKEWARVAIQVFAGIVAGWALYFGWYWLRSLYALTGDVEPQPVQIVVRTVFTAAGFVSTAAVIVAAGTCVRVLARPGVRAAVRDAKGDV